MIKMVDDDDQSVDGWSVSSMTPLPGADRNKKNNINVK